MVLSRATGLLLVIGAVVFWIGAFTPPYKQWMGPPLKEYLTIIGQHPKNWLFINACFAVACLTMAPAMGGFASTLSARGDRGWAWVGFGLIAVGGAMWLVNLGHRLAVTPWAALELAHTGEPPAFYEPSHRWVGLLFGFHMVSAYLAIAAFGLAVLRTGLLPPWMGWTGIVFGLVAVPGLATPLFQPPLMVHVVPFIWGIGLLRAPPS